MLSSPAPRPSLDASLRDWLRKSVGEVELVRPLVGGITGEMLQLRRLDGGADVVVRRWSTTGRAHPDLVRREVAGLAALDATDVPAPTLLDADPDGTESGCPTTLTTFLPGRVELAPTDLRGTVRAMAAMLAHLHSLPAPPLEPCVQWGSGGVDWLEDGTDQGLLREVRELAARPADPMLAVLSHGDYQHFNVLWRDGAISAVVDWPTAGLADRGLDVGHCRLNLAVLHSAEAAMWFLEDYEQLTGERVDPAADIQRLLGFGPTWPEFIPLQVAGRAAVDGPGMAGRVRETILATVRRAG